MKVTMWDVNKYSLVKRCQEKEADDYKCISRITPIYSMVKDFRHQSGTRSKYDKRHFEGMSDLVRWRAVYEKKDEEGERA